MKAPITQERLKELLHYDPETGLFVWLKPASTKLKPGDVAGSVSKVSGYREIRIGKDLHYAHRLAFLYMLGEIPKGIDHKNRTKSDNRWENLRPANQSQNNQNKSMQSNNTSGARGVHLSKGKWCAEIWVEREKKWLGSFDSLAQADAAARRARAEHFGEFACQE